MGIFCSRRRAFTHPKVKPENFMGLLSAEDSFSSNKIRIVDSACAIEDVENIKMIAIPRIDCLCFDDLNCMNRGPSDEIPQFSSSGSLTAIRILAFIWTTLTPDLPSAMDP